jgi:hypothetical protein
VLDSSGTTPVGLGGWTVELQDVDGNVLDSAVTAADGSYRFSGLPLGTYRVRDVVPAGWVQKSAAPADVLAVQGATFKGINFRNVRATVAATGVVAASTAAFGADRIGVNDVLSTAEDASVLAT